jgi:hypothetical protein
MRRYIRLAGISALGVMASALAIAASAATSDFVMKIYMPGIRASSTTAPPAAPTTYSSCAQILAANSASASGPYTLTLNGASVPTYCDMATDGGGWTLVGNQVPTAVGWADTTADINPSSFGSLASSWRYGNGNIQTFTPSVGWRIAVDSGSLNLTEKDYFKPSCVINWTTTYNASTLTNTMPLACQQAYSSTAFASMLSSYVLNNASVGIGQNNNGGYCSARFAATSSLQFNAAYSCNSSTAGHLELWVK